MLKISITVFMSGVLCLSGPLSACTGLRLVAKDGGVVVGRTMEFGFDVQSKAAVVPSGTKVTNSLSDPTKGINYVTKYGMVGATVLGKNVIVDGINEKGLYAGGFYFPGYASYSDPAKVSEETALAPEDYCAWILGNFATIEEVKAGFNKVSIVPNPIAEIGGESFPGHFVIHDRSGKCVVIEPLNQTLKIYDNPVGVFTNSPSFDWHLTNLRNYINLTATNVPQVELGSLKLAQFGQGSGLRGIPGDFTPPSRFVRATAFSQAAEKKDTAKDTVLQVFHTMNNFDIPVGAVKDVHDGEVHSDYTVWTTCSDLKNLTWAFRTYDNQGIRSIDLTKALAAAKGKVSVIEMNSSQVIEDISTNFK